MLTIYYEKINKIVKRFTLGILKISVLSNNKSKNLLLTYQLVYEYDILKSKLNVGDFGYQVYKKI